MQIYFWKVDPAWPKFFHSSLKRPELYTFENINSFSELESKLSTSSQGLFILDFECDQNEFIQLENTLVNKFPSIKRIYTSGTEDSQIFFDHQKSEKKGIAYLKRPLIGEDFEELLENITANSEELSPLKDHAQNEETPPLDDDLITFTEMRLEDKENSDKAGEKSVLYEKFKEKSSKSQILNSFKQQLDSGHAPQFPEEVPDITGTLEKIKLSEDSLSEMPKEIHVEEALPVVEESPPITEEPPSLVEGQLGEASTQIFDVDSMKQKLKEEGLKEEIPGPIDDLDLFGENDSKGPPTLPELTLETLSNVEPPPQEIQAKPEKTSATILFNPNELAGENGSEFEIERTSEKAKSSTPSIEKKSSGGELNLDLENDLAPIVDSSPLVDVDSELVNGAQSEGPEQKTVVFDTTQNQIPLMENTATVPEQQTLPTFVYDHPKFKSGSESNFEQQPEQQQESKTKSKQENLQKAKDDFMVYYDSEILKLQAQLRMNIEDLESNKKKIDKLVDENTDLKQTNNLYKSKISDFEIEIGLLRKKKEREVEDLKSQLDVLQEKDALLREKLNRSSEQMKKIEEKFIFQEQKVRGRERELENQLELIKADTSLQIQNRDSLILELKRKVEHLDFLIEQVKLNEQNKKESQVRLEGKMVQVLQSLKGTMGILKEEVD